MLTVDEWQSEWGWDVDMMCDIVPASFFRFAMRVHDESSGKSYLSKRRRRFEGDRMPLGGNGWLALQPIGVPWRKWLLPCDVMTECLHALAATDD